MGVQEAALTKLLGAPLWIMQKVTGQLTDRTAGLKRVVRFWARPSSLATVKETQANIWVPTRGAQGTSVEEVAAPYLPGCQIRAPFGSTQSLQGLAKFLVNPLVCIQREHQIVLCQAGGSLLLRDEAVEWMLKNPRSGSDGQIAGEIRRAAV